MSTYHPDRHPSPHPDNGSKKMDRVTKKLLALSAHKAHFTFDSPSPFRVLPRRFLLPPSMQLQDKRRQARDVYDMTLSNWRASVRRKLLRIVRRESVIIAKMQVCVENFRTPSLDAYFVYTSLGTHTFFMTLLPALFFFGYRDMGAGLTIETHHLEYGFPSTHSTNSVSIGLLFFGHVYTLATSSDSGPAVISQHIYALSCLILLWYTFSIVYGRLYTAMHSFIDCLVGVTLGAVDDCPCFEDAIAFLSVVLGQLLSRWFAHSLRPKGSFLGDLTYTAIPRALDDILLWWTIAAAKMILGILIIFTWRLLAKSLLHLILPPMFRFLSRMFSLPNRRFYTPATDYKSVPSEFNSSESGLGLRPIPSVIDLPGTGLGVGIEVGGIGSGVGVDGRNRSEIKSRAEKGKVNGVMEKDSVGNGVGVGEQDNGKEDTTVKHYELMDYLPLILTKVIVYAGIAILACEVIPMMFELLGWGVKSWPS
ncbi:hypothetical protein K435DRAFT_887845 [Dendrothele bispora CBS 962.96]|uniref:Phosphatidic acid phosphatase type 2/haloperoxidase domain-containing protein n=1 Tax=Dendrothele bispora (strain CBS 962.96) TaxID=1314807 RepID=A0A4S8KRT6_DENBC|nr:hypothetical protein K435DRAFT_887845 [Dendrothele bispora CBS 962.96]